MTKYLFQICVSFYLNESEYYGFIRKVSLFYIAKSLVYIFWCVYLSEEAPMNSFRV